MPTPWGVGSGGGGTCCAGLRQIQTNDHERALIDLILGPLGASAAACATTPPAVMGLHDSMSGLDTCPRVPLGRGKQGNTWAKCCEHARVVVQASF